MKSGEKKHFIHVFLNVPRISDSDLCLKNNIIELKLNLQFCNCIVTRGGVYDEISPEPEGNPESQYSHSQSPLLANIFSY